jgi:hypothetical protein
VEGWARLYLLRIPTPTPPTFWQVIVADVMMMIIIIIAIAVLRALPHATELQISTRDLGSHACIDIDSIGASQTGVPIYERAKNKAGFHDKVSPYAGSRSAGAAQVQGAACRCSRVHWCGVRRAFVGRIERQSADCSLQCIPLRKPGLVHHIGIGQSMGCMLDFSKPLIGIHHDHDETSKHTHDHICRCDVTSKSRLQLILSFHIRGTTFLRITRKSSLSG